MTGAGFVLAINLFVAALFCLAFVLIALTNRSDRVAPWFAVAYLFGIAYIVCEFVLPLQLAPRLTYVAGFTAFLGAVGAVVMGIARRYLYPTPRIALLAIIAASILANWIAYDFGRESLPRMFAYQTPYAVMQALAAWIIFRSGRRQPMDLGLGALFAFSALQFLSKPLVAGLTGGPGVTAQAYIASNYALFSQSLGAILQVGLGLLMLMVLFKDMLMEVTIRSETDVLSGLLNRRGFEDRVPAILAGARRDYPAVLIAADLDNFKSINDTFGHDVGDEVIRAFASLVEARAPETATIARNGGEEFAILLPGTTSSAARMFAEAIRAAFSTHAIAALPQGRFCTVSLGVAESIGDEAPADLRRRADAALYAAKRAGRDRVSVATAASGDVMPNHPMADRRASA